MKRDFQIFRDQNGVVHVEAQTMEAMYQGQGYAQARDRGMQILLMRILGQGRLSEILDSSDESLDVDRFFRKMNWGRGVRAQVRELPSKYRGYLEAFTQGLNLGFEESLPWELKLLGYKHEPWLAEHSGLMSRMIGYLTLSQSQAEMERLFVEMVQAGVEKQKLEELFPGLLDEADWSLIKKVRLGERLVEPASLWGKAVPRMMASNNWVVSGEKTASGKPLLANDPHLETNRLPNVWVENVLTCKDRTIMGGAMPGFPGILSGRTNDLAWGVTYAFCDTIDSWIEHCKDGKFKNPQGEWTPFQRRVETILRKGKPPVPEVFYENHHGVLDGDPFQEGYYLTTRWAAAESGAATLASILGMWEVTNVVEAMDQVAQVETDWSFVLADKNGKIGFQMSGLVPARSPGKSGFVPLPGWEPDNEWLGFMDTMDLPRSFNPAQGFFCTANHDLNAYGLKKPINMPMGPYRADRIAGLLKDRNQLTAQDMADMHGDVYSTQAEQFMEILRPLLPDTPQGSILSDWNLEYTTDSKGASLFESFYRELYAQVFGTGGMGGTAIEFLWKETGAFVDFYLVFDRVLLSKTSAWYEGRTREEIWKAALDKALATKPEPWGKSNRITLVNILLGGKLPAFLGFDIGPVERPGGRATVSQGQVYRSASRATSFMPSYRMIHDMAQEGCQTNLSGGPSDRRFGRWYTRDLENWKNLKYKKLTANPVKKLKFP